MCPKRAPFPGFYSILRALILVLGVVVAWFVYRGVYDSLISQEVEPTQASIIAIVAFGVTLAFWIGTLTAIIKIGR